MDGMDGMSGYYGPPFQGMGPPHSMDGYAQDNSMDAMVPDPLDDADLGTTQTLHQIISQNNEELMRRRNTYQPQYRPVPHEHARRASMLEFGSAVDRDLANFQFDPNPNDPDVEMVHEAASAMPPPPKSRDPRKVRSREDLSLNTRFSQMNTGFDLMGGLETYSPAVLATATTTTTTGGVMEQTPVYLPTPLDMAMDFDAMATAVHPVNMQPAPAQGAMFADTPLDQDYALSYQPGGPPHAGAPMNPPGTSQPNNMTPPTSRMPTSFSMLAQPLRRPTPLGVGPTVAMAIGTGMGNMAATSATHASPARRLSVDMQTPLSANDLSSDSTSLSAPAVPHLPQMPGALIPPSKYANAYSASGFDMLGVLMRVATRPRPEINIGPVDLSCAFVVCDIEKFDLPIVYCSEMFERLTGYTKHEILGRNCRFLQAPDGKVQAGVKRKYVDDNSVLYLKNQIAKRAEAQLSLINYRKGGQPFMNLLTMIPIQFDTEDYKFFVGFQVDLVEQPGSVSARNPDGSYAINYNRSALPAYALPPVPDHGHSFQEMGQTIPKDDVSKALVHIGQGESEFSKRIWDKILLENTDDVVHVLSLKGLFLYLSPASRKVLEYDAGELVGTALSAVCHPSDIVPVTRELKDSSSTSTVNLVYRIRRKFSGYTWFEAHGSLHTEQGKGKKCIILVGRQRPVFALDRAELSPDAAVGDSELWSKLSTAGMFLFVSSTSRIMLDRLPEDLVGTSFQALMRPESKREFQRALEAARTGEKSTTRHDLQNRRGQVLHAQTTIYPGDARPGAKPTFLLAQTRLLKMTRAALLNQKSLAASSPRTDQASVGSATPATHISAASATTVTDGASASLPSDTRVETNPATTITAAGSHGLRLGNQDDALASDDNIFDELKTTRSSSWQFELRQMERQNRMLAEELQALLSRKKKRKRRKGLGQLEKDCANCHTRVTPEWRRGPSGNRDLCNSCGLRWAKQNGRVSPRKNSSHSDRGSTSPAHAPAPGRTETKGHIDAAETTRETKDESSNHDSNKSNPVPGVAFGSASTMPTGQPDGDSENWRGAMPPKIDEGDEPPHPHVLPT